METVETLPGIEYERDTAGHIKYVRIDIEQYGENESLQDFLDGIEVMSRKGRETVTLAEFNKYIDERLELHV